MKPQRIRNKNTGKAQNWWLLGENRPGLREALNGKSRYIVTVETAKHRLFAFVDGQIIPDNKLWVFPFEDAYYLGVLSSGVHRLWTNANAGSLGTGQTYVKTECFDTFPFPDATAEQRDTIRTLAEYIESARRNLQTGAAQLTLTQIYNALETGDDANVDFSALADLHRQLDEAVMDAYGWSHDLTVGQILNHVRLLNLERSREENMGIIRKVISTRKQMILFFGGKHEKEQKLEADYYRYAVNSSFFELSTDDSIGNFMLNFNNRIKCFRDLRTALLSAALSRDTLIFSLSFFRS